MESWRNFRNEVYDLDRRELISLSSLKQWAFSIVLAILVFMYTWKWAFPKPNYDHYPEALRPSDAQIRQHEFALRMGIGRRMQLKEMNIVVFACESHVQNDAAHDALVTMKSAAIFTSKIVHFHIFTEDRLYHIFMAELDKWPNNIKHRVAFHFHHATYPESIFQLNNSFDTSSCQLSFLFLPNILSKLEHVIYVKSGSIFLTSPDTLWANLLDYTERNAISLLPLYEKGQSSKKQENDQVIQQIFHSDIMLFDMARIRETVFEIPIQKQGNDFPITRENYKTIKTTWQPYMLLTVCKLFENWFNSPAKDILNIIAFFNPDVVNQLPCSWGCNNTSQYLLTPHNNIADKQFYNRVRCLVNAVDFRNMSSTVLKLESFFLKWYNHALC
ncbi:glucoside xylosyltransferase 2-like [Ciona intestinalis]